MSEFRVVHKQKHPSMPMEEKELEAVVMQFGSHHPLQRQPSTLLDQFERLSFEIQLNQAILRRSLSEPAAASRRTAAPPPSQPPLAPRQGKRRWSSPFRKALRKLIRPFLGRVPMSTPTDGYSSKRFSRSVRV